MQVQLRVAHQKANVKEVTLTEETLIGRSAECNLKIASNQVSRRHCRIIVAEGRVFVQDLDSANGTFVDGQRIAPNAEVPLAPGCGLSIGPVRFVVQYSPLTAGAGDETVETVMSASGILAVSADEPEPAAEEAPPPFHPAETFPEGTPSKDSGGDTLAASAEETLQFKIDVPGGAAVPAFPQVDEAAETVVPGEIDEYEEDSEEVEEPQPKPRRSLFGLFGKKKSQPAAEAEAVESEEELIDEPEVALQLPGAAEEAEETVAFMPPAEEDADAELGEDDIAGFLGSAAQEDDEESPGKDEGLGDFLKQF